MKINDIKTKAEALAVLKELQLDGDPEGAHMWADDVLCKLLKLLGHEDVVEEYSKVDKWYA